MSVRVILNYKEFSFSLKTQKSYLSSGGDWWEYAKSYFKKNGKIFSKNSTTQENIIILRLK